MGDRVVHGWNPAGYAALLGVEFTPPARLAPAELAARLDVVLAAAERIVAPLDHTQMAWTPPERQRTIRDLAFHVFRLSLAFTEAADRGVLPEAPLQEKAPPELVDGGDVARYGALVRARLAGWFQGAGADDYERVIAVYYGDQPAHELLERTTWHAAQHLRQLHDLATRLGVHPAPLPTEVFQGLPLPAALW